MLKRREFLKAVPAPPAMSEGYWLHVHRTAMACRFEVTLPMDEQAEVEAATSALEEVARLEQQLTIFQETSEVSFINRRGSSNKGGSIEANHCAGCRCFGDASGGCTTNRDSGCAGTN